MKLDLKKLKIKNKKKKNIIIESLKSSYNVRDKSKKKTKKQFKQFNQTTSNIINLGKQNIVIPVNANCLLNKFNSFSQFIKSLNFVLDVNLPNLFKETVMAGTSSILKQNNNSYKNSNYLNQILFKTFVRQQRKIQFSLKTTTNNTNDNNGKNKSLMAYANFNKAANAIVEKSTRKSNFLSLFNKHKASRNDNDNMISENKSDSVVSKNISTIGKKKSPLSSFRRRELFLRILDFNFFVVF